MAKGKLTDKERCFIDTYLTNGFRKNDAYLAVWNCSESTAHNQSYKTFNRPEVQEYLIQRRNEIYNATAIDAQVIVSKLAEIAFAAKGDKDYNAQAQLKALDLLQKQLGLQTQKVEAEVSTDINITIEE